MERSTAADLPIAGEFPELDGATAWLNSNPLTPSGLRGKVVVVQFCTFSCVNWLRTLPYVRAWAWEQPQIFSEEMRATFRSLR